MQLLLSPCELFELGSVRPDVEVRCLSGCCWLTQENDDRDHILRAGSVYRNRSRGSILITALSAARLQVADRQAGISAARRKRELIHQ